MKFTININRISESGASKVDFDNIPFGRTFSDHMFVADYADGEWGDFRIEPFGYFPIHPSNLALHYGQSIFEGMKASKDINGRPLFMRPEKHLHRLNESARRMCMPEFPEDVFLEALHQLVGLDHEWIPKTKGAALYIRPFMFATGEFIGVKESDKYRMIIFTGPVGPYYPRPITLVVEEHYVRAAHGGVGEAKTAGNYAASLLPAKKAIENGYDQVMWMDAKEFKYVQEVGTMNLWFVINGKVLTPKTDGAILKGITRLMIIDILRDKGYEVEERLISIDEIVEAYDNGQLEEIFGSGTAAVVAHVSELTFREKKMVLPPVEDRKIGQLAKDTIDGLRAGTIPDTYGWMVPVKSSVEA